MVVGEGLETFAQSVRGQLLRQGDDGFNAARTIWNGMIDRRPDLIVRCAGAADVTARKGHLTGLDSRISRTSGRSQ